MNNNFLLKCIRHTKWLVNSLKDFRYFSKAVNNNSYVFISHNADNSGGAPVVLLELVRELCRDYNVIFLSAKPGALIYQCYKECIPAYSFYGFRKLYINKIIKKCVKAVVVNTMNSHWCMNYFNIKNCCFPTIWWLHEERRIIERLSIYIPSTLNNVKILAVSERVKEDFLLYAPQHESKVSIIYYGCKDLLDIHYKKKKEGKFLEIVSIGRICERKNQIQIVNAYNLLPSEIKKYIKVQFVAGSFDPMYKEALINKIMEINAEGAFEFTRPIDRAQMPEVYYSADLVICSSIDDPLPVVVTEAMMLKTPYITSSQTGHYRLVNDGVNGFVYNAESDQELSDKIQKIYKAEALDSVLINARKTYEKYFTPNKVKQNFLQVLNMK